jgi:hypothetical protein
MSKEEPEDAWAGVEFAFPEPDWPPDEDDLRLYLPWISRAPGPLTGAPETTVRARVGRFARTLRIELEHATASPSPRATAHLPIGPVHHLPSFDRHAEEAEIFAAPFVLAACLRVLRPGFFGLAQRIDLRRGALRVTSQEPGASPARGGPTTLELDLPEAREELVLALARALRASGEDAGLARVTVDEIGSDGASKARPRKLALDEELELPDLPFEWTADPEDRSTFTVEVDFQHELDDEARATLLDLSRAFVAASQIGLLPARPPRKHPFGRKDLAAWAGPQSHGAAVLTEATDSLPDQWTLALEDFDGDPSCIHPYLEALAELHRRWPIQEIQLVC